MGHRYRAGGVLGEGGSVYAAGGDVLFSSHAKNDHRVGGVSCREDSLRIGGC